MLQIFALIIFLYPLPVFSKEKAARDWVIAIDIGHASFAGGANSARGRNEYEFNRDIGILVQKELVKHGYSRAFIILDPENLGLRTKIARKRKVDLFISFHHDSVQSFYLKTWKYNGKNQKYCDMFQGFSLLVSTKNAMFKKSLLLATILGRKLKKNNFLPTHHHAVDVPGEKHQLFNQSLGVYRYDDLVVLKTAPMPAVLVEVGVIVNRNEELQLRKPETHRRLAKALVESIQEYQHTLAPGGPQVNSPGGEGISQRISTPPPPPPLRPPPPTRPFSPPPPPPPVRM
ncbi:MAG TPA: N-acetylmuramoyl-L-alanine amidase [Magnetococcales bacterium]|nr:N-acetylmuramoyl-L-alanine amidase [Magnetococcales bacterium]